MMEFQKAKSKIEEDTDGADEKKEDELDRPVIKKKQKKMKAPPSEETVAAPPAKEAGENSEETSLGDLIENRKYQLSEKAVRTRAYLMGKPLVKIMIPRMENEPKDAVHPFSINGFSFVVRKGVYQEVPEDIAMMIAENYGQDARLVADHPLNLKNNSAAAREFSR